MKRTITILILLIVIGILSFVLYKMSQKEEPTPKVDTAKSEMKAQLKLDSIEIKSLKDSLAFLKDSISNNQTKIIYIKTKANEKANSVSHWSTRQYNEFLTSRYKDSIR
jgi:TPP-dependent trihydroxycyclohexane-1,2-dione (THcHDO) dehydratase